MDNVIKLRIFRSFNADYYKDDILHGPEAYPDAYFAELKAHGFNGVWLRGVLRDLVSAAPYPDMGADIDAHQEALRTVVARGARHGVKVFLYLNEPLAFPADHPFYVQHPEAAGAPGASSMDDTAETRAMCTSEPKVREWLRNAAQRLFEQVPGLGGWFCITASEHHTHCYSHRGSLEAATGCPRCDQRSGPEIVSDVVTALRDGTRAASSEASCIVWNWSWAWHIEADPQPELLSRLPKDVILMGDWERGGWHTMPGGRQNWIDEYSLSYVGPAERFIALQREAAGHNLEMMAKFQVGTTHELGVVPNLPLIDNLYEKLSRAETLGMSGTVATWNFGNSLNWNTAAFGRFFRVSDRPGPRQFVADSAAEYFPGCDAGKAAEAVSRFSEAMRNYPFSIPFLYSGPLNYALQYPLNLAPLKGTTAGRSWMPDERGDDLSASAQAFTIEELISLLSDIVDQWKSAVDIFEDALQPCSCETAAAEQRNARMIGLCSRSARNVYQTFLLRRDQPPDKAARFQHIISDEIDALEAALPLVEQDTRFGFHAECQTHLFTASGMRKKLTALRELSAGCCNFRGALHLNNEWIQTSK